jgi:hypothetical protein
MAPHTPEGSSDGFGESAGNGTFSGFGGNGDFGNATSGFGNATMGGPCSANPFDLSCLIPEGVVVDYNDAGLGPRIRATAMVMAVVATLSVVFRLWSRKRFNGKLHMEDWIIASTIPLTWLASVSCWWGVRFGAGRHWWNVPPEMSIAAVTDKSFPVRMRHFAHNRTGILMLSASAYMDMGTLLLDNCTARQSLNYSILLSSITKSKLSPFLLGRAHRRRFVWSCTWNCSVFFLYSNQGKLVD